jgi:hypothetical protein
MPDPDEPAAAPPERTDRDAWALKERCIAAWSTDPREATLAAEALRALAGRAEASPQSVVHHRQRSIASAPYKSLSLLIRMLPSVVTSG